MAEHVYDVVIIGAGTAGQTTYSQAIKYSNNILVINDGKWDTTCARVGCMPSKLLIEAAKRAHKSQTADEFGIHNTTQIDGTRVMQRVQQKRDYFAGHAQAVVDEWPSEHKLQGRASFVDANTLKVGDQLIHSKATVIATGSTPVVQEGWREKLQDRLLTSDTVFELPTLPKSLAVIGTGAIGIELAQAFARLGVEVHVFARKTLLGGLSSPELRQQATDLIAQDLNLITNSTVQDATLVNDRVQITYSVNNQAATLDVEYLLYATGRSANLMDLNLQGIDSKYTGRLTPYINEQTRQLDQLPIFVAGDVAESRALQHEAAYAGRVSGMNAARYPNIEALKPYTTLGIVFSDPQMATAGQGYEQLTKNNIDFRSSTVSFQRQGRATVMAENKGGIELYGCPTSRKLLGAELLTAEAEHMAHLLAWSIQQGMTVDQLLTMPFYHPVLEEGLRSAITRLKREIDSA